MSRLFTSDFDRFFYGEVFVALMNKFYDKIDDLQEKNKEVFADEKELSDMFGLLIQDKTNMGVQFYDETKIPHQLMEDVFSIFKEVFFDKEIENTFAPF